MPDLRSARVAINVLKPIVKSCDHVIQHARARQVTQKLSRSGGSQNHVTAAVTRD
jgi:hypothetical protein